MIVICLTDNPPHLDINGKYDADPTPLMYDPNTLLPTEPFYIVKCNDGMFRKFDAKNFIPIEEYRENRINNILDNE